MTTGGKSGCAIQHSAGRGGGGGSLRYGASSLPNRSSSLTYALGRPLLVRRYAHVENRSRWHRSRWLFSELKLSGRVDRGTMSTGRLIGDEDGDDDGEVDGVGWKVDGYDILNLSFAGRFYTLVVMLLNSRRRLGERRGARIKSVGSDRCVSV